MSRMGLASQILFLSVGRMVCTILHVLLSRVWVIHPVSLRCLDPPRVVLPPRWTLWGNPISLIFKCRVFGLTHCLPTPPWVTTALCGLYSPRNVITVFLNCWLIAPFLYWTRLFQNKQGGCPFHFGTPSAWHNKCFLTKWITKCKNIIMSFIMALSWWPSSRISITTISTDSCSA